MYNCSSGTKTLIFIKMMIKKNHIDFFILFLQSYYKSKLLKNHIDFIFTILL